MRTITLTEAQASSITDREPSGGILLELGRLLSNAPAECRDCGELDHGARHTTAEACNAAMERMDMKWCQAPSEHHAFDP